MPTLHLVGANVKALYELCIKWKLTESTVPQLGVADGVRFLTYSQNSNFFSEL